MLNSEIKVGHYYEARVSGNFVVLRVDAKIGVETRHGGNRTKFQCWNMRTNRERVTTAAKLRREVPPPVVQPKPVVVQDTTLSIYKVIGKVIKAMQSLEGEALAEFHNKVCDPPIRYLGDGIFE